MRRRKGMEFGVTAQSTPPFRDLIKTFARIGCLSFGGPVGQIALMHREVVEERGWVSEDQYLHALNFCHFLPGPEAQQLATWIGWKLHGWRGGLAAGLLFVVPGALVILALSIFYAAAATLGWFAALFLGIKAAVLALVVQALLRIATRALDTPFKRLLAVLAFAALALFALPFPLVIGGMALIGFAVAATRPGLLGLRSAGAPVALPPRPWAATLRTVVLWGSVWALPMVLVLTLLGREHVLWQIGVFFSQLAVVTFGGAYAVLAYMAQEAVNGFGWLSAGEMADGLGLAESTPGPLIMVTQFVGYLAAFRAPEPFTPLVAGIIGAALTTWVTFAPCFLWIFAFAPWIERMERAVRLKGALAAVTAAIVGVIGSLALWFGGHLLFRSYDGGLPVWTSLDWRAAALSLLCAGLLFRLKWGVLPVLGTAALGGLALSQF
ncbi:MAG: chromate efflux transporter [Brevundimonas sp.]|nr:chromate efflux transporter [Brevundimonas sp.]